ncbi:hypothetical protein CDAR_6931 [Caerostris darwini]|uniref:Uncharacterized protein n=1 Tax=Caerostris darwini TaxID=1538125 RepID=A0AAV4PF77_9ARAC|nr:hypothetical protein CDAR_6931 [Caerostris darwini]
MMFEASRSGGTDLDSFYCLFQMKKRRASTPILHAGSKFRHGLLQLMIHSIDPLHDGRRSDARGSLFMNFGSSINFASNSETLRIHQNIPEIRTLPPPRNIDSPPC